MQLNSKKSLQRVASTGLATEYGLFTIAVYVDNQGREHIALIKGEVAGSNPVLTRIHSRCLTGDVFSSHRCDCRQQLISSLRQISDKGKGLIIYLDQEGRGIGLVNKIRAYALQDRGLDTVEANLKLGLPADSRDYSAAIEIIKDLNIKSVDLLTNNPAKVDALRRAEIKAQRISLPIFINRLNYNYLLTKKRKLGHLLCLPE